MEKKIFVLQRKKFGRIDSGSTFFVAVGLKNEQDGKVKKSVYSFPPFEHTFRLL
jgi:hypothetical protein